MSDATTETPRRTQLLSSAVTVIARSGLRGLTHRAVDREAEFPEGTCSVNFRTRAALLSAVTTHVGNAMAADVRALADAMPNEAMEPLQSIPYTREMLGRWLTEDGGAMIIVTLELYIESLRSPELVEAVTTWRTELVNIVEGLVVRTGQENTRTRAETTVASLQGIIMSALALPEDQREAYIDHSLYTLLSGPEHI